MAYIGDSCLKIGDTKWNIGSEASVMPSFVFQSDLVQGILNGFVNLTATVYASEFDTLTYHWGIELKPHDSLVDQNGIVYRDGGNSVLLYLDKIGLYKIRLVVNASDGGCSLPGYIHVLCTPFDYNYINQTALDASWLWKTLPDFWQLMPNRDRSRIEVFWRGLTQMLGADLLNAYNVKESASIATIKDSVIRRWTKIDLILPITQPIIKIQETKSFISEITSQQDGFVTQISQIPVKADYTYSIGCKIIGRDRVEVLEHFLTKGDIGKFVRIYTFEASTTSLLDKANIIKVEYASGKCVVTLSTFFDAQLIQNASEVMLEVSVNNYGYPCIIQQSYDAILSNDGKTLTHKRVPKLPLVDNITVGLFSFIIVDGAEANGVSKDDVIICVIRDVETGFQYSLKIKVAGCVDKYVLFNIDDPFSMIKEIVTVFEPLSDPDEFTQLVYDYVTSVKFKQVIQASVFYNTLEVYLQLTSSVSKSYQITFDKIYRRKKTTIDQNLISVTRLTERIERVELQGNTLIPNEDDVYTVERPPLDLMENLDFYVDPNVIIGKMLRSVTLETFTTQCFDFNFVGVENGDTLFVQDGFGRGQYDIVKISADGSTVYVNPPARLPFIAATFKLKKNRLGSNRHITFYNKLPQAPLIDSLWCESAVYDNNDVVDLNFGALCNFRFSNWYDLGLETSFRDIVIAILMARMTAPSINNLASLTSNIAGIPFLDTKARIVDIHKDFEVSAIDGITPTLSNMIVEEIDSLGVPTGIYRNIKFRPNTIFTDEAFTGLAINPKTGSRYKIGDTIEQFATIALGIVVEDLYNQRGSHLSNVKDRHKFKVTVSADAISISGNTINLIKSFIMDIKPSYTDFMLSLIKFIFDTILVEEDVSFKMRSRFFDNPYVSHQVPQIQDEWTPNRQIVDNFSFIPLNTDFPTNGSVVLLDNTPALHLPQSKTDYINNLNLRTQDNSSLPDSVILNVGSSLIRPEIVSISFVNSEVYVILDCPTNYLAGYLNKPNKVRYTFIRFIKNILDSANISYGNRADFVPTNDINVSIGDYIYLNVPDAHRYRVNEVSQGGVFVAPQLPNSVVGNSVETIIRRPTISPSLVFQGNCEMGGAYFFRINNIENAVFQGIEPGDKVNFDDGKGFGVITAVTREDVVYFKGKGPIASDTPTSLTITRTRGANIGDNLDETVTAAVSDTYIRILRQGSQRFPGKCHGNYLVLRSSSVSLDLLKLGDMIQINEAYLELTEGVGVARIVSITFDSAQEDFEITVNISENIMGYPETPINVSFYIIKQANHKLTRIE